MVLSALARDETGGIFALQLHSSSLAVLPAVERHCSSTSTSAGFSSAAATRSLSLSCLLTGRPGFGPSAELYPMCTPAPTDTQLENRKEIGRTCVLTLVGTRLDSDVDLEPLWETAEQTNTDGQPCRLGGVSVVSFPVSNVADGDHKTRHVSAGGLIC